jgi:allose kinase
LDGKYYVGVDVGGTHVRIGMTDGGGRLSAVKKVPRREALPDEDPAALAGFIAAYLAAEGAKAAAAGVGIPGTLDRSREKTLKVPNLPCLDGLPYAGMLSERLGIPVYTENDTVMLLTGDLARPGTDCRGITVGIYVGTGLGSAVFLDGRPLRGKNGLNELGHMPLPGRREKCGCGNVGCAENYVSGRRLEALRREKYPDVHISDMFTALRGSEELEEYVDTLGCVIAAVYNLLDPDRVILSGGVPAMKDFPLAELRESVRAHTMKPQPSESAELLFFGEGGDSGVLGAALFAKNALGGR